MRIRTVLATVVVLLTVAAGAYGQYSAESGRLGGADRIGTAVAISQHAFPDLADEVYLANAQASTDALVGGTLTAGPILLVPQCGDLPERVASEIYRLAPLNVYALGGTDVVCDRMVEQAAAASRERARDVESVEHGGAGTGTSKQFDLSGGDYRVRYRYSDDCVYRAALRAVRDGQSKTLPMGEGPVEGEQTIRDVMPGTYVIEVDADHFEGCEWAIELTTAG